MILAGRRINDGMGKYVAEQTVKHMIQAGFPVKGAKVNVLGLTFKENCPDLRNSRVIDVISELRSYGADVHVHDPVADAQEAVHEYGVTLRSWDQLPRAHAMVVAVAHREFTRPAGRRLCRQARARRAVRRREVPGRRRSAAQAWRIGVAPLMRIVADGRDACRRQRSGCAAGRCAGW